MKLLMTMVKLANGVDEEGDDHGGLMMVMR